MTELPNTFLVTQSFTLQLGQVAKVSELAERLGVSKSKIVQAAVDMFYASYPQPAVEPTQSD